MSKKMILEVWIRDALLASKGRAQLLDIAKYIWTNHEEDLRSAGDLFYTWQYDMRWAADRMRRGGVLRPLNESRSGIWELAKNKK